MSESKKSYTDVTEKYAPIIEGMKKAIGDDGKKAKTSACWQTDLEAHCYLNGIHWKNCTGDNFLLAMAQRIEDLESEKKLSSLGSPALIPDDSVLEKQNQRSILVAASKDLVKEVARAEVGHLQSLKFKDKALKITMMLDRLDEGLPLEKSWQEISAELNK